MRFVRALINVVLIIIVCEVIMMPFLTPSYHHTDGLEITCAHYDFSFVNLLKSEEEQETEKSTANCYSVPLLDFQEVILQLENLHSTSHFQPIKTVASRYSLFRALLI